MLSTFDEEQGAPLAQSRTCPHWCARPHGVTTGEEDWLHVSEPLSLAGGVLAQLCMSIDPETGSQDGPYVLIGDTQYTPAQAEVLGARLIALSNDETTPP